MMKAVIQSGYGDPEKVLSVQEIPVPQTGDDEVLVKVRAASMHADVWHLVTGLPRILCLFSGWRKPKIPVPGTDISGVVEAVGNSVTRFKPGDEVFGSSTKSMSWNNGGAYAEFAAVPEKVLVHKPRNINFEQAASIPTSGMIAYLNLRAGGDINTGEKILINGAGGAVGSIALQLAKSYGAEVTGVDNTGKLELLRSLGADHVIDYTRENVIEQDERYDRILDVASTLPYPECKRILKSTGVYLIVGHAHFDDTSKRLFGYIPWFFFKFVFRIPFDRNMPRFSFTFPTPLEVLSKYMELLEQGKITPVVNKTFPLNRVPAAIRCMVEVNPPGRIIITP